MNKVTTHHVLSCPVCSEIILKGTVDDVKIRSRVLLMKSTGAYAVCKGCSAEVSVPLRLESDVVKSLPASTNPRLFIAKTK